MKTLDKTKKGLKCCFSPVGAVFRCGECPYQGSIVCKMSLHNDAIEHIERLEAKNEAYKQSAINSCYESRCNTRIKELEDLCGRLLDEKEQLERERNAAVEDLKMLAKCPTCAHYGTPCGPGPCANCHPIERQGYVWRGVKEGETHEQDS